MYKFNQTKIWINGSDMSRLKFSTIYTPVNKILGLYMYSSRTRKLGVS